MPFNKLVLFVDEQNFYHCAREAFFSQSDPHFYGQFDPIELGKLICTLVKSGPARQLHEVRVYTGCPDASKQPKAYAAHMKQRQTWEDSGAKVFTRVLQYPQNYPNEPAKQKGVDVALAIDCVALAVNGGFEVGVIASVDTDLRPALEFIKTKCTTKCRIEVAAWTTPLYRRRLSLRGHNVWCHQLDRTQYDAVADLTDYSL